VISRPSGKGNNGESGINFLEKRFLDELERIFEEILENIRGLHQKVGRTVNLAHAAFW
jgi:hypothetical protein